MAKKKDDFDFDDDFELDLDFDGEGSFELDAESNPKGRNPVTRFTGGFLQGVRQGIFGEENQRKLIDKALPQSYSTLYSGVTETLSDTRSAVYDVTSEVRDQVGNFKKQNKQAIKGIGSLLPFGVGKKISDYADKIEVDGHRGTEGDQDELAVSSAVSQIFQAQQQNQSTEVQIDLQSKVVEGTAKSTALMQNSNELIFGIARNMEKIVSYQDTVGVSYQRKMLETSLQHLYVSRKHLNIAEQQNKFLEESLKTLVHNTGLPDVVKMQSQEFIEQQLKAKFIGAVSEPVFQSLGKIRDRALMKIKKQIIDTVKNVTGTAGSLGAVVSDYTSGGDGMDIDLLNFVGGLASSAVMGYGANKAGEMLKELIDKDPKLKDKVGKGDKMIKFLETVAPQYAENNILQGKTGIKPLDSIINWFGLGELKNRRKNVIMSGFEKELDKATVFDLRTRRTITDVIPGLLSRIHLEVHQLNGGKATSPLQYDWKRQGFSTQQKLTEEFVKKSVATKQQYNDMDEHSRDLLKQIDPDFKLSEKARNKIVRQTALAGIKNEKISILDFVNPRGKYHDKEIADFIKERYKFGEVDWDKINNNEIDWKAIREGKLSQSSEILKLGEGFMDADIALVGKRNKIARTFQDPMEEIIKKAERGDISSLRDYPFVEVDEDSGDYTFNHEKFYDYVMSERGGEVRTAQARQAFNVLNRLAPRTTANRDLIDNIRYNRDTTDATKHRNQNIRGHFYPVTNPNTGTQSTISNATFNPVLNSANHPDNMNPDLQPPPAGSSESTVRTWASRLRTYLTGAGIALSLLGVPGAAEAASFAGDVAMNGITMANGSTLSLIVGGTLAGSSLFGQLFNRNNNQTETQEDSNKKKSSRQRKQEAKREKGQMVETNNLLKQIAKLIEKNSVKENMDKQNAQMDTLIQTMSTNLTMGVFPFTVRPTVVGRMLSAPFKFAWKGAKKSYAGSKYVLGKIHDGISWTVGKMKGDPEHPGLIKKMGLWAWEKAKVVANKTTGMAKDSVLWGVELAGDVKDRAKSIIGVARTKILDMYNSDIYLPGEVDPRILLSKLKQGHYRQRHTGKVVRSVFDLTQDIVDENGNIVLTIDELKNGVVDKFGKRIDGVVRNLKDGALAVLDKAGTLAFKSFEFAWDAMVGSFKWAGSGFQGLKERVAKWKEDKNFSLMLNFGSFGVAHKQYLEVVKIREMMEGIKKDGTPSYNDKDGDGDRDGGVDDILESREEAKAKEAKAEKEKDKEKKEEKKESKSFLRSLLGGVGSFLFGGVKLAMKAALPMLKAAIPALIGAIGLNTGLDFLSRPGRDVGMPTDPNDPRLDPTSDQYDARLDPRSPEYDPYANATLTQKIAGGIYDFNKENGMLATLGTGYVAYRGAKFVAGKALGLAGRGLKALGSKAWGGLKAGGSYVKANGVIGTAKNIATGVGSIASKVAGSKIGVGIGNMLGRSTAVKMGAGLASRVGAMSLAPLAGAALPWVLGATALFQVGKIGYDYYQKHNGYEGSPITRLRMASYGYDLTEHEDQVALIFEMEDYLKQFTIPKDGGKMGIAEGADREHLMKICKVNTEDEEAVSEFSNYITFRFLPVYLVFASVANNIKQGTSVLDIDDKLTYKEKLQLLAQVYLKNEEKSPYEVMANPFGELDGPEYDKGDVDDIFAIVRKKLRKQMEAEGGEGGTDSRKKAIEKEKNSLWGRTKNTFTQIKDAWKKGKGDIDEIDRSTQNILKDKYGDSWLTRAGDFMINSLAMSSLGSFGRSVNEIFKVFSGLKSEEEKKAEKDKENEKAKEDVKNALAGKKVENAAGQSWWSSLFGSKTENGGILKPAVTSGMNAPVGSGVLAPQYNPVVSGGGSAPSDVVNFAKTFTKGLRIGSLSELETSALAANTAKTESSFNMKIINGSGYAGLYQFGTEALTDIGYMKPGSPNNSRMRDPSQWVGGLSLDKYLNSRELQDKAYVALANKNLGYGRTFASKNGKLNQFESSVSNVVNVARYIKMAHLKGASHAWKGVINPNYDATDGNGTSMQKYGAGAAKNVPSIISALGGSSGSTQQPSSTPAPPPLLARPGVTPATTPNKTVPYQQLMTTMPMIGSSKPATVSGEYFVGDSIAHGFRGKGQGNTREGASSKEVLEKVRAIDENTLKSKEIVLSTGYSNSPTDTGSIEKQLEYLKSKGAKVKVIGVSNNYKGDETKAKQMNDNLKALSDKYGATFTGGFKASKDTVHPERYDKAFINSSITPTPRPLGDTIPDHLKGLSRRQRKKQDNLSDVVTNTAINTGGMLGGAPWMAVAKAQLGKNEASNNADIKEYHKAAKLNADRDTAWCSSFVCWCLEEVGVKSTKNAVAYSYDNYGDAVPSGQFPYGAIITWTFSHVSFCAGVEGDYVLSLGGNQSSKKGGSQRNGGEVTISRVHKSRVKKVRLPKGFTGGEANGTPSTVDGQYSMASTNTTHNAVNGYDPNAKFKSSKIASSEDLVKAFSKATSDSFKGGTRNEFKKRQSSGGGALSSSKNVKAFEKAVETKPTKSEIEKVNPTVKSDNLQNSQPTVPVKMSDYTSVASTKTTPETDDKLKVLTADDIFGKEPPKGLWNSFKWGFKRGMYNGLSKDNQDIVSKALSKQVELNPATGLIDPTYKPSSTPKVVPFNPVTNQPDPNYKPASGSGKQINDYVTVKGGWLGGKDEVYVHPMTGEVIKGFPDEYRKKGVEIYMKKHKDTGQLIYFPVEGYNKSIVELEKDAVGKPVVLKDINGNPITTTKQDLVIKPTVTTPLPVNTSVPAVNAVAQQQNQGANNKPTPPPTVSTVGSTITPTQPKTQEQIAKQQKAKEEVAKKSIDDAVNVLNKQLDIQTRILHVLEDIGKDYKLSKNKPVESDKGKPNHNQPANILPPKQPEKIKEVISLVKT